MSGLKDFQAELNGIIANPSSRPRQSRRNMAWPKYVITPAGESIPADNAQELRDILAAIPGSKIEGRTEPSEEATFAHYLEYLRSDAAEAAKPRRKVGQKAGQKAGQKVGQYNDSYAMIAKSVGGSYELCPGINWDNVTPLAGKGKYGTLLFRAGLTPEKAAAVLTAMDEAGVLITAKSQKQGSKEAANARQILLDVGGISCPLERK